MDVELRRRTMCSRGLIALTLGAGLSLAASAAGAEPMPRPQVDYRASVKTPQGTQMTMAHSQGRMRMDVTGAEIPGTMTSFIDLSRGRMTVLIAAPGIDKRALEIELPASFAFVDPEGEGTRTGTDMVAGEACDLWVMKPPVGDAPVETCITADGIVLRASTAIEGKNVVVYEVVELERAPQDPALFELPKGVKVTKIPPGVQGLIPNLGR